MTERTKQKIEENLAILCQDLGLDQSSPDAENQANILRIFNALTWIADDVEAQCERAVRQP